MAFDNPSRQSLMPTLVPKAHFANAVSLNSDHFSDGDYRRPNDRRLLIARGGLSITYLLNAVSFLAVILRWSS